MSTYHQRCHMTFSWEQFPKKCSCVWVLHFQNNYYTNITLASMQIDTRWMKWCCTGMGRAQPRWILIIYEKKRWLCLHSRLCAPGTAMSRPSRVGLLATVKVATWVLSQYKDGLSRYGMYIRKIRSHDRLIFIIVISILIRQHIYIETTPDVFRYLLNCHT